MSVSWSEECPKGLAWSDEAIAINNAHNLAECSNRGHCNNDVGNCVCDQAFAGLACQACT